MKKIIYIFMLMLFALNPLIAKNLDKDSLALNLSFAKELQRLILYEDVTKLMDIKAQMKWEKFNEKYSTYSKVDFMMASIVFSGGVNGDLVAMYNPFIDAIMMFNFSEDRPLPKIKNFAFISGETFRDGEKSSMRKISSEGLFIFNALHDNIVKTKSIFEKNYLSSTLSGYATFPITDDLTEYNILSKDLFSKKIRQNDYLKNRSIITFALEILDFLEKGKIKDLKKLYPNSTMKGIEDMSFDVISSLGFYDYIKYKDKYSIVFLSMEYPQVYLSVLLNSDLKLDKLEFFEFLKINK